MKSADAPPSPAAAAREGFETEVPVSAIEHYSYCPRQCALIHVEQTFDENQFTIRGRIAHERVDTTGDAFPSGVRVLRGLTIWSHRLALRGRADVVEMRGAGPYPVEYKVGRRRGVHAELQLCAQALCLEEMTGVPVPLGAVFYHAARRRREVRLDRGLRRRTEETIAAVRRLLERQTVPPAVNDARCRNCSLIDACMPGAVGEPKRIRRLHADLFRPLEEVATDDDEATDIAT